MTPPSPTTWPSRRRGGGSDGRGLFSRSLFMVSTGRPSRYTAPDPYRRRYRFSLGGTTPKAKPGDPGSGRTLRIDGDDHGIGVGPRKGVAVIRPSHRAGNGQCPVFAFRYHTGIGAHGHAVREEFGGNGEVPHPVGVRPRLVHPVVVADGVRRDRGTAHAPEFEGGGLPC